MVFLYSFELQLQNFNLKTQLPYEEFIEIITDKIMGQKISTDEPKDHYPSNLR